MSGLPIAITFNPLTNNGLWLDQHGVNPPPSANLDSSHLVLIARNSPTVADSVSSSLPLPVGSGIIGKLEARGYLGASSLSPNNSSAVANSPMYLVVAVNAVGGQVLWSYPLTGVILPDNQSGEIRAALEIYEEAIEIPAEVLSERSVTITLSAAPDSLQPCGIGVQIMVSITFKYVKAINDSYVVNPGETSLDVITDDIFVGLSPSEISLYDVVVTKPPLYGTASVVDGRAIAYNVPPGNTQVDKFTYQLVQRQLVQWMLHFELVEIYTNPDTVLDWNIVNLTRPLYAYPSDYEAGVAVAVDPQLLVPKSVNRWQVLAQDGGVPYYGLTAQQHGSNFSSAHSSLHSGGVGLTSKQIMPISGVTVGQSGFTIADPANGITVSNPYYYEVVFTHPAVGGDIYAGAIVPITVGGK
jgi:hypothetical protein